MTNFEIKYRNIDELKGAKWNPRSIDAEAFEGLKKSLETFGMPQPIIFNKKTGNVVGGHQRMAAAKALKWEKVPVIEIDVPLSEEKALNVTLNNQKISGHFTHELGKILDDIREDFGGDFFKDLKFDEIEVPPLPEDEQEKENERADNIPETKQNELGVKLGDLFELGEHRVLCGDSMILENVERLVDGKKADMVFTDPPYGIDVVNGAGKIGGDTKSAKATVFKKVIGDDKDFDPSFCLEYSEKVFFWGGNYFAHKLPKGGRWFVWDKNRPEGLTLSDCELAWSNVEGIRVQKFKCTWDGYHKEGESGPRLHPNQKPIKLLTDCLNELNPKSVIDIFLGSGSTLIACEKTNRKCYGMEIDPHYCSVIIKRWETFTGKKAKKI